MNEDKNVVIKLIQRLADLERELERFISKNYYNSQPVASVSFVDHEKKIKNIEFKLPDILLIGALTQSSVLLSGSSGSGKTLLAKLITKFLFGKDGTTRKNITPDMNEQDFIDIDFGAIKEGKKLKEAISADELFSRPCLIIDEANRAPPIIQNRLMQILENNIDLKSKIVHAGVPLHNDSYYHWNILTLNYGTEYAGTSRVDRALKDRIVIDIPIDNFPPNLDDQIKMIQNDLSPVYQGGYGVHKKLVFQIYKNLKKLDLSLEAEALILYLSFTSNCVKSPTKSKYGVNFSPQFCKEEDCQFARNPPLSKICPYTFAPSNRVLRRLVHTAKGFHLLKKAKIYNYYREYYDEKKAVDSIDSELFEASLEDVISIAPLILNSKISMNKEWVLNKFSGNTFLACKFFLNVINDQLEYFMKNLLKPVVKEKNGEELTEKEKGMRKKALKEDFHYKGLIKYVKRYLT